MHADLRDREEVVRIHSKARRPREARFDVWQQSTSALAEAMVNQVLETARGGRMTCWIGELLLMSVYRFRSSPTSQGKVSRGAADSAF